MTEKDFNPSADDRRILALLDDLQSAPEPGASKELDRPYLELLGMLPYGLERADLPTELGERILSNITQSQAEAAPAAEAELASISELKPAATGYNHQAAAHLPLSQVNRWLLPLAAGLTALFVGLSTWQFYKLEEQSAMIAAISTELSAQGAQHQALVAVKTQLASSNSRLAMVTNPGVEICALRPVGSKPMYPAARGVLYVAENHQHWYLAMEGLEPRPAGESYQLWFHADDGAVGAGTFRVVSGGKMELSSETMPLGTKAVSITIEPEGGMPRPTGQEVLYGSDVMQIF